MNDFNARDLFAGLAMVGMKANKDYGNETDDKVALWAYDLAEAMIKEKEKRDGGESKV